MRRGASSGLLAGSDDLAELGHLLLLVGVGKLVEDLVAGLGLGVSEVLEALAPDAAREVQVLLHHGDSRRVDGAEVGVLEETGQVALGCLLQREESLRLEAKLTVDALADGADESLEGRLGEEVLGGLLVALDLAQGHSAWPPAHLLLHAAVCRRGLLDEGALAAELALACLGPGGHTLLA